MSDGGDCSPLQTQGKSSPSVSAGLFQRWGSLGSGAACLAVIRRWLAEGTHSLRSSVRPDMRMSLGQLADHVRRRTGQVGPAADDVIRVAGALAAFRATCAG